MGSISKIFPESVCSLLPHCLQYQPDRIVFHWPVSSEKVMAPHSSTLAWKIPWTEEPGGLQFMGSQRVGHDRATSLSLFTFLHWRRKWQPTPVFLPGESQGQGEPGGLPSMGCTESDMWSDLAAAVAAEHLVRFSQCWWVYHLACWYVTMDVYTEAQGLVKILDLVGSNQFSYGYVIPNKIHLLN